MLAQSNEERSVDSSTWDERYAGSDLVWSATPNQWVEQVAVGLAPGRVLDLAGGEGRNALWLADLGWQATVVDFSQVALDRACALAAERFGADDERLVTVRADLLTYQPEPGSYDLVLVVYLQLSAEARRTALLMAATAVAPGGMLLVVAHDSTNLTVGVGGPQDPHVLYTCGDVEADLAGTGLVIERSEAVLRTVETESGPREAIDALLVAVRTRRGRTPTREAQS
jgi:SAM-dependent methyltransferase